MKSKDLLYTLATIKLLPRRERNEMLSANPNLLTEVFPTFTSLVGFGLEIAHVSFKKLVTTLVLAIMFVSLPGTAQAFTWILHHQGQALNTNGRHTKINGGHRLATYQYDPNDDDQHFSFVWNESKGAHMMVNMDTGECVNVYRPGPNRPVNVYTCDRNDPEQQFHLHRLRTFNANNMDVMVELKGTGLCLDNPHRANGTQVQVHYCNANNPNHVWRMDKLSDYIHPIPNNTSSSGSNITITRTLFSNRQLFISDKFALNTNFAFPRYPNPDSRAIQMGTWVSDSRDPHQRFTINQLSNGASQIIHLHTGQCLSSVTNAGNGTPLVTRQCDQNNQKQHWDLLINNGRYLFRRHGTNQCIDIPNRQVETIAHLWNCYYGWNNANQIFQIGYNDVLSYESDGTRQLQADKVSGPLQGFQTNALTQHVKDVNRVVGTLTYEFVANSEARCTAGSNYNLLTDTYDNSPRLVECFFAVPFVDVLKVGRVGRISPRIGKYIPVKLTQLSKNRYVIVFEELTDGTLKLTRRIFMRTNKVQKVIAKHGNDWGYKAANGSDELRQVANKAAAQEETALRIISHIEDPATTVVEGKYRGADVIHYYQIKRTPLGEQALTVSTDKAGNMKEAFLLSPAQTESLKNTRAFN